MIKTKLKIKVKTDISICPLGLFVTISCGPVSEDSCWELKCRENRLVTAFKTLQKSHLCGTLSENLIFAGLTSKQDCRNVRNSLSSWWIKNSRRSGERNFQQGKSDFSHLFSNWARTRNRRRVVRKEGEDSLFTIPDMFSDKGRLSKQVTFSTPEKWFWPSYCNLSSERWRAENKILIKTMHYNCNATTII